MTFLTPWPPPDSFSAAYASEYASVSPFRSAHCAALANSVAHLQMSQLSTVCSDYVKEAV